MQLRAQTPPSSSTAKHKTDDEFWPLSEKAYYSIVLSKSHVRPHYNMYIPAELHPIIPSLNLPVTLTYHGRNWAMNYFGRRRYTYNRFDYSGWRTFCDDNNLRAGDACVFELIESSSKKLRFGVQILRGDIPVELRKTVRGGEDIDNPILID